MSGSNFAPLSHVEVYFDRADFDSGTTAADGSLGAIGLQVPAAATPGTHWVTVVQPGGGGAQLPVTVSANWPQLGGPNATRDGFNPFENVLDPVTSASLQTISTANTGSTIRSSPAVVGDTTYVGSDDGILYAFAGCSSGHCHTLWRSVPMVIVSPYAKAAYTDSSTASLASILAYVEHALQVQPLTTADANALRLPQLVQLLPAAAVARAAGPAPRAEGQPGVDPGAPRLARRPHLEDRPAEG